MVKHLLPLQAYRASKHLDRKTQADITSSECGSYGDKGIEVGSRELQGMVE
jgi:hypothetical protein